MGIHLTRAIGFRVIGIDRGDEKRELCDKLGCEVSIDFKKVDDVAERSSRLRDAVCMVFSCLRADLSVSRVLVQC
jgi:D-arabinose 1-dehydrogenase-like Zn-dependent alcohol dehydrogenase